MRTAVDLSPLFRSGIGFERVFNLLEGTRRGGAGETWPPYDIIKAGDDEYRITMAVAGFDQEELTLTHEPNLLVVTGTKAGEDKAEYLHRGIAWRTFERRFELADHVHVASATLENGLLTIYLKREIPEGMKPRRIAIGRHAAAPEAEAARIGKPKLAA